MRCLVRNLKRILEFASALGAVALIAISLLVSVDVLLRWILGRSIVGVFEISSVLLVMATFFPLGLVFFRGEQLRVDIIFEWVKGRPASLLSLLDVAIGVVVFGLLLWIATGEFQKAYSGRFLLRGMIEIPTWIPLGMICTGAALALLTLMVQVIQAVLRLMGRPDGAAPVEPGETES